MSTSPNEPGAPHDPVPQRDPGPPGKPLTTQDIPTQQQQADQQYTPQRRQAAAGIGCSVLFVVIMVIWYLVTQSGLFG